MAEHVNLRAIIATGPNELTFSFMANRPLRTDAALTLLAGGVLKDALLRALHVQLGVARASACHHERSAHPHLPCSDKIVQRLLTI
jgi:hypothetical protein